MKKRRKEPFYSWAHPTSSSSVIQSAEVGEGCSQTASLAHACSPKSVLHTVSHASPCCLLPLHLLPIHSQQLIQFGEELRGCWAVILLAQDESDTFCRRRDCGSENAVIKHGLHNPEESVARNSSSVPEAVGLPVHIFSGHLACWASLMPT